MYERLINKVQFGKEYELNARRILNYHYGNKSPDGSGPDEISIGPGDFYTLTATETLLTAIFDDRVMWDYYNSTEKGNHVHIGPKDNVNLSDAEYKWIWIALMTLICSKFVRLLTNKNGFRSRIGHWASIYIPNPLDLTVERRYWAVTPNNRHEVRTLEIRTSETSIAQDAVFITTAFAILPLIYNRFSGNVAAATATISRICSTRSYNTAWNSMESVNRMTGLSVSNISELVPYIRRSYAFRKYPEALKLLKKWSSGRIQRNEIRKWQEMWFKPRNREVSQKAVNLLLRNIVGIELPTLNVA